MTQKTIVRDEKSESALAHAIIVGSELMSSNLKRYETSNATSINIDFILENAPEAIYVVQDGKFKYVNKKVCEILGCSKKEMLTKYADEFIHPEDRKKVVQNYFRRLNGEEIEPFLYRGYDKDGDLQWRKLVDLVILWEGRPATLNFVSDVTPRVRAEEALKKSERQLADIMNFLPDATFACDDGGRIIAWNKEMEKLSGVKAIDMIGKNDYEYALPFYGVRRPMLIDMILHPNKKIEKNYVYYERKKNFIYAVTSFKNKKATVWVWAKSSIIYDHHENIIGAVETIRDITDSKIAENELKEKTANLEAANTALKVLLKHREEDRNEIENKFVRNINEMVLPYIEKLKVTGLTSAQVRYVDIAEKHLNEVVSPFLVKMSNKHGKLTPREVRIASLIKDGKTSKEIAEMLNLEVTTINNHRARIRRKLDLKGKERNLRSYLLSF